MKKKIKPIFVSKFLILSCYVMFSTLVWAQTNPTAQKIPYSQNFGTTTFSIMPTGIAAWKASGAPLTSQNCAESSTSTGDASITSTDTIQSTSGCYGYATNNNGRLYIQTGADSLNSTNQCVLSLTTAGMQNIKLSYDIEMISAKARTIGVVLQVRVGTSGGWYTVPGYTYTHSSSDRSNGQVDEIHDISFSTYLDNLSVVQFRWATWMGTDSASVPCSGIALDNISVTGVIIYSSYYFRSKQTGNWNDTTSWEMSTDNSNWSNASFTPDYKCNVITVQTGHHITLTASDTVDQLVINGTLTYGDNSGSILTINEGAGIDLTVNGTFEDFGPNAINWIIGSSWELGNSGTLIRTRGTTAINWHYRYNNGMSNAPETANWIIRKTGNDNPTFNGGNYFPNLIIENNTEQTWVTGSNSSFTGSSYIRVKGDLDIGGNGTGSVTFSNDNTFVKPILVSGDINVRNGSTLQNNRTGFEIRGDLVVNGTLNYGTNTNSYRYLVFSGGEPQTISGSGTLNIYNLVVNKETNNLNLNKTITIDNKLYLINKNINLGSYDLIVNKMAMFSLKIPQNTNTASAMYMVPAEGNRDDFFIDATVVDALFPDISEELAPSYIQTTGTGKLIKKLSASDTLLFFPVGDATFFTPIIMQPEESSSLGANAEIAIRVVNSAEPHVALDSNYINRYWDVTLTDANLTVILGSLFYENDIVGNADKLVPVIWTTDDSIKTSGLVLFTFAYNNYTVQLPNMGIIVDTGIIIKTGNYSAASICDISAEITSSNPDNIICAGNDTLTANTADFYNWSTGATTQSIVVSTASTYSVTISDNKGCRSSDTVNVIFGEQCNMTASSDTVICLGSAVTLNIQGCVLPGITYSWSTGDSTAQINVTPDSTTTYIASVIDEYGCSQTDTVIVTVASLSDANAGKNDMICPGDGFTLTAGGGSSYMWDTGDTTASVVIPPDILYTTHTYHVLVKNTYGCKKEESVTIYVITTTADAGSNVTVCSGDTATLTATGGISYLWSSGDSTAVAHVAPVNTTTYIVTVTNAYACTAVDSVTVAIGSPPQADAGANDTICAGLSDTLTATGGTDYLWSTSDTTAMIIVNPDTTTMYYVTVSNSNGCIGTPSVDTVTVNVNSLPTAEAGTGDSICVGLSDTLTASGGASYHWSTGDTTATTIVTPDNTTTYWVTVYNGYGCSDADSVAVTAYQLPNSGLNSNVEICLGQTDTLTASGGVDYLWSTGDTTASIIISPASDTAYFVTITNNNSCSIIDTVTVTVHSLPNADAGEDSIICNGVSTELTATGGTSYYWSTSENTAAINVAPDSTTTYWVSVTDVNGCTAQDSVNVTVNSLPVAEAGENISICIGATDTLTASGGVVYHWSTGDSTVAIAVSPNATTAYAVTVTNTAGCTATDNITVTVNPLPDADAGYNASIALGDTATIIASGGTQYHWDIGDSTAAINVSPSTATIYYVTVTDANGCSAMDDVTVLIGDTILPFAEGYWQKNDSVISTINGVNKVGIGTKNPIEVLSVVGNIFADGKIKTNRITSIDSLLYFGDSSLVYTDAFNRISAHGTGQIKGMAIGSSSIGKAIYSLALGYMARAYGDNSVAIGNRVFTDYNSANSIVIGSGPANSSSMLTNNIQNSLMVGFNSQIPTFFVGTSDENTGTGNVGIGTTIPKAKLEVRGNSYFGYANISNVSFGACDGQSLCWGTSYIGFNAYKNSSGLWETQTDGGANGGCLIYGNVGGAMIFSTIPSSGNTIRTDITDSEIFENARMVLYHDGSVGIGTATSNTLGNIGNFKLAVNGAIGARRFVVTNSPFEWNYWYDCVFEKNYDLPSLKDVEAYIYANKHLPDIPSENEINKNGQDLGQMNALLLKKIEELYLYTIEQQKQIDELKTKLNY